MEARNEEWSGGGEKKGDGREGGTKEWREPEGKRERKGVGLRDREREGERGAWGEGDRGMSSSAEYNQPKDI